MCIRYLKVVIVLVGLGLGAGCYGGGSGDDSTCGTCPSGEQCVDGVCVPVSSSGCGSGIVVGDLWRYFKGVQEPPSDWATEAFDDSTWLEGPTGIGYGDGNDATELTDMMDGYLSVYLRHTFELECAPSSVTGLRLEITYDDAFVAYLNGVEVARANIAGTPPAFDASADTIVDDAVQTTVDLMASRDLLQLGQNTLAIQVHNRSLSSSDLDMQPALVLLDDDCDPSECASLADSCNTGGCDPDTGDCIKIPVADGTPCDDGQSCTTGDSCTAGVCGGEEDCEDDNICTEDGCDDGNCYNRDIGLQPGLEGPGVAGSCSDGLDNDCDGAVDMDDTSCHNCSENLDCDDGNMCTSDECNDGRCENRPLEDGTPCNDGQSCTAGDECTNGVCSGDVDCEDVACADWPGCSAGELVCNRTEGVAPLAVFCDATAGDVKNVDLFHNHGYSWDFGDPTSGNWSTTGRSKNTARGPLAAHVFETPGTFTIRTQIKNNSGDIIRRMATITVRDPDDVFPNGEATVCFSRGSAESDFIGCPAGADKVTLTHFHEAIDQQIANGKRRLLFKRGDTFYGTSRVTLDLQGPGIIGAYGSGAAPAIHMWTPENDPYTGTLIQLSDSDYSAEDGHLNDWRIMDFQINGNGGGLMFEVENTINRLTILRLNLSNMYGSMTISTSKPDYYGQPVHSEVAVVDCSFSNMGGYGAFVSSKQLMFLGNRIMTTYQHVVRTQHTEGAVFSNNYIGEPYAHSGHALVFKLHAEIEHGVLPRPTSEFVITGNVFIGAPDSSRNGNDWNVCLSPQSSSYNESISNGILDGNYFIAGKDNSLQLDVAARNVTVRNNIFVISNGASDHTAVRVARLGSEPSPEDNRIYNNTCYTTDDSGTATFIHVYPSASNTLVHNNLMVAPNVSRYYAIRNYGSDTDRQINLVRGVDTFVTSSPSTDKDFCLSSSSNVIDVGSDTGIAQSGYGGVSRDTDGNGDGEFFLPDVGAFEYPCE